MMIEGFVRRRKIAREAVRRKTNGETPEPLARYLAQTGQERLLTHEEEIDLGRRVRGGLAARRRERSSSRRTSGWSCQLLRSIVGWGCRSEISSRRAT
jgi:hypothetical protein